MKNSSSLISILGTTSTGKTSLALKLAEKYLEQNKNLKGIAIISADSRQVYQGLEVLTGADVPLNFVKTSGSKGYDFFKNQSKPITLHGISIIFPDQEWSLAHFRNMAVALIKKSWQHSWLPME